MLRRIIAITLILICTSVGWMVLGQTIDLRTHESGLRSREGVASIWGTPQEQVPPSATYEEVTKYEVTTEADGRKITRPEISRRAIPLTLESSRVEAKLALEHRQRGLLWYSTYVVSFGGRYVFRNPSTQAERVKYRLNFPAEQAIYDGLSMELNGRAVPFTTDAKGVTVESDLGPQETALLGIAYRSQGLDRWGYTVGAQGQARDFALTVQTNFKDIDFPLNTLAPTQKRATPGGWELEWRYASLISGFQIGVTMPEKLQPGPLAGQISYFAPVSLLLFFFLMLIITTLRRVELHPMNYFFLAAAFFSFHLLLAYLVDHVSIHLALAICSVVSVFLVVSYLRLVVGPRFAIVEAGGAQMVYLVLFSYAFFLKGFTGLAVTAGCIVTLFVVMQMTARIRWAERF